MDDTLAVVGPRYADNLLDDYYDFGGHDTVQQGEPAGRLLLDHDHTFLDRANTVIGYVVPLDSLGLDPHEIDAFLTDDCPEYEVERIHELISAESQRLVAAHQKRCRDAASDDVDAGEARGAPRRAVEGARPADQQLEPPAPKKDDGSSRQQRTPAGCEPIAATPSLKRDAGTQVSEAQLRQECVGRLTRDVSTQVSEDELRNDDDGDMGEHSPSPVDEHQDPVEPFVPSELEVLSVNQADDGSETPDAAGGVYEDGLPFDGSGDFTEYATFPYQFEAYYTASMDQDFVGFIDDFCD